MSRTIHMVVGCPGSGKSWVCDQLQDLFEYVHHDLYIGMSGERYIEAILNACESSEKPILIEAPFSVSEIKNPLEAEGHSVIPVYIVEDPSVISERYLNREVKEIPNGHLTRQKTYERRAGEDSCFFGTSEEVLNHLRDWYDSIPFE